MDKPSAPQFIAALNGLAEALDHRPVTAKGLEVWFDTLREFETQRVIGLINGWAKTHAKFPAPADMWKVLNEDRSAHLEATAAAEKKIFAQGQQRMLATPHGRRCMEQIRGLLQQPKPTMEQHWLRVLDAPELPEISYRYAREFLSKRGLLVEREPGQDDEEVAA